MIIASYEKLSMIKYTTFSSAARLKKEMKKLQFRGGNRAKRKVNKDELQTEYDQVICFWTPIHTTASGSPGPPTAATFQCLAPAKRSSNIFKASHTSKINL